MYYIVKVQWYITQNWVLQCLSVDGGDAAWCGLMESQKVAGDIFHKSVKEWQNSSCQSAVWPWNGGCSCNLAGANSARKCKKKSSGEMWGRMECEWWGKGKNGVFQAGQKSKSLECEASWIIWSGRGSDSQNHCQSVAIVVIGSAQLDIGAKIIVLSLRGQKQRGELEANGGERCGRYENCVSQAKGGSGKARGWIVERRGPFKVEESQTVWVTMKLPTLLLGEYQR